MTEGCDGQLYASVHMGSRNKLKFVCRLKFDLRKQCDVVHSSRRNEIGRIKREHSYLAEDRCMHLVRLRRERIIMRTEKCVQTFILVIFRYISDLWTVGNK